MPLVISYQSEQNFLYLFLIGKPVEAGAALFKYPEICRLVPILTLQRDFINTPKSQHDFDSYYLSGSKKISFIAVSRCTDGAGGGKCVIVQRKIISLHRKFKVRLHEQF